VLNAGRNHASKELLHLLGPRGSRDVPIAAVLVAVPAFELCEQLVTHATADDPGAEAAFAQANAQFAHFSRDRAGQTCGVDHRIDLAKTGVEAERAEANQWPLPDPQLVTQLSR